MFLKDNFHLVKIIFCLQGCACLLHLNVFMNSSDYFISIYFPSVMTVFSSIFLTANLIGLFIMIFIGHRLHFVFIFVLPYIYFILSLLVFPIMEGGYWSLPKYVTLIVTILILILSGLSTSVLEGGIFGKAYLFPNEHNAQMVMFGIGLVGFLIAVTKSAVKFLTNDPKYYFYAGSGFMVICFMSSFLTLCLPYSRKYFWNKQDDTNSIQNESTKPPTPNFFSLETWKRVWCTFKVLDSYCFYIFTIFFITMSIYPGICSILPTSFPGTFMDNWYIEILILLFCTFDFIGRTIPSLITLKISRKVVRYVVVWGRTHFLILFILYIHPIFFIHSDFVPIIMMVIMAFTNGYFSCIIMNNAKILLSNEDLITKEIGGNIMTFFMLLGISMGSIFSILIFYSNNFIFNLI